jgi:hypothetical protein
VDLEVGVEVDLIPVVVEHQELLILVVVVVEPELQIFHCRTLQHLRDLEHQEL